MGETTSRKMISATIDRELHKEALLNNISWTKALQLGVTLMLGQDKDLNELKKERDEIKIKIDFLDNRIAHLEAEKENQEDEDKKVMQHIDLLKECNDVLKRDISYLKGRTKLWMNKTKMIITPEKFYQLCKRFERGEFVKNNNDDCD